MPGTSPASDAPALGAPWPAPLPAEHDHIVGPGPAVEDRVAPGTRGSLLAGSAVDLGGVEEHLVSLLTPGSVAAEHYRTLRHLVEGIPRAGRGTIVAVTSASRGDGKTTTAINLAGALAQAPSVRVLLVDADLRSPAIGARLALDPADVGGLADAISRPDVPLARVIRARPPFNLSVLTAGPPPSSPYEALRSRWLGELLEEARRQFDFVILDTPPLLPVPDCRVLEPWVDGFLLVVAAHRTPRPLVEEALQVLASGKVLGIVFNMDDAERRYYPYSPYAARRNGDSARPGRWLPRWRTEPSHEW
jgi:capsular exopolysaccharide synthesis family protein